MEENKNRPQEKKNMRIKRILISAAVGAAAMMIFLAAYYLISGAQRDTFYDGAGEYSAFMADGAGIESAFSGVEIRLMSDGNCTITFDGRSEKGKWSRSGDAVDILFGAESFSGTISGNFLEISYGDSGSDRIILKKSGDTAETSAIPAGSWKIAEITDVFSVYPKDILEKTGYGDSYLVIDGMGTGSADIFGQGEAEISADGKYIHYKGLLLEYTFSDKQLVIRYSDGVSLVFEK